MQPLSSATTGALAAVTPRSSTGHEPGTTGSLRSLTASDEPAREWLLRQASPGAADAALCRSLISTLGVTARAKAETRFPEGGRPYQVVVGFGLIVEDREQLPAAIAKVHQALTPASVEQCEGWLVMLQAACARRTDSAVASTVAYALYASELRQWPADVAKSACERLARGRPGQTEPNWFPTLAELVAECERLAAPRKALLASLQRWAPEPQKPQRPSGDEERAAIRRMADEALASLRSAPDRTKRPMRDLPSIAGKTDEGGLTAEMRALMARGEGRA